MSSTTIVIADRHPVFLCGLGSVLRESDDFKIVASCREGIACIKALRELSPDLVLIDMALPGASGLDILATAIAEGLPSRVLFLAESVEERTVTSAAAKGAYGVLPRETSPEMLMRCLRRVARGRRMFPLPLGAKGSERKAQSPRNRCAANLLTLLTERERQIVQLVSEGLSNKDVGNCLALSDGTIKVHLHNIYQKLAIHNRTTLAALVMVSHENVSHGAGRDALVRQTRSSTPNVAMSRSRRA